MAGEASGPQTAPGVSRLRGPAAVALLVLAAAVAHRTCLKFTEPLTRTTDADGLAKLEGIQQEPSFAAALARFWGDDPQGVHTFRPLPALTLWAELRLWGYTRWAYELANLGWWVLLGLALAAFCRTIGLPEIGAFAAALLLLGNQTLWSGSVLCGIATRHDLLLALFGLLAYRALWSYLGPAVSDPEGEGDGKGHEDGAIAGSGALWAYAGWSLLAYLSKEQALGLALVGLVTAAWRYLRGAPRRRCLVAAVVSVGVALVWFAWYRLAERNMGPVPHASHSFAGMWALLKVRWPRSLMLASYTLAWPLGTLVYAVRAEHTLALLIWPQFWKAVIKLIVYATAAWVTWRRRPDCLIAVMAWKLCTYLPVLPLNDTWPWYRFMPHALEPVLLVAALLSADAEWDLRTRLPLLAKEVWAWARASFAPLDAEP